MSNAMHVLDLLPAYILDSLEADEVRLVEQHLVGCLICRAESHKLRETAGQLVFAAPSATPSPELKSRLLQHVQKAQTQPRARVRSFRWFLPERLLPLWGLVSLFLIFALTTFNILLWQRLNRLEILATPGGMRAFPLMAAGTASNATGFVIVGVDGRNGALVVDRLPPLDEGWQYQLWLIRDGRRTSGAVFSTDEESYGGTRINVSESLLEYSAVDITIEPVGGSLQPTGTKVLGGRLFIPDSEFPFTPSG
jgi:anti-sigma-K factor RskA